MFSASRFSVSVYAVFASLLFMAFLSSPASAQTLTLAECTEAEFRQAVAQAPAGTAINFGGDCEITLTEEGGSAPIEINKDLTIDGGVHNVTISGGGEVGLFFNTNLSTFTLKNLTLADGAGVDQGNGFGGGSSGGGAVYNVAKLVVERVAFRDNRAFDAGGAIYSRGPSAEVSVTDSMFEGNYVTCTGVCSAHGGGGAIAALAGGETRITDSVFRDNTAFGKDASGGAILGRRSFSPTATGPITITGSTFEENKALTAFVFDQRLQAGGGAVSVFNRELTITGSDFTANEATTADSSGNPGVGFNNQAFGGAIIVEGETVPPDVGGGLTEFKPATISDTNFTDNASTAPASFGGAVFILRAPTSITRGTFTGNTAERTGAIDNAGANLDISDSEIKDNVAIARNEGFAVGGVYTRSRGTQTTDGRQFEGATTFTDTDLANNVNGNCAVETDEEITDNGGNSENPGASCGFNGANRVEESRPDATDDEYEFEAGTTLSVPAPGVLENDSDPEGEAMGAELVGEPRRGAVVLDADGSFEYTPDAGAIADTFTYRVKSPDKLRQSRVATVKLGVASEIVVNTTDDGVDSGDNACTLREAVISADLNTASGSGSRECAAGSENDTITFDLSDDTEITLGGSDIEIPSAMTIDGSTANGLTISGGGESRAFSVTGGSAEIKDLAITKGADKEPAGEGIGGGGIFNSNLADLTLTNVLVTGNTTATIGGGVRSLGDLTVKNSSITDNTAESHGGAIHNNFGSLTVEASTLSGNTSTDGLGGGIFSTTEDVSEIEDPLSKSVVRNSTISNNTAETSGGGVHNDNGLAVIENSTITNNEAPEGSGVSSFGDDLTRTEVSASIIAENENTDVEFTDEDTNSFESNGHNLIGSGNAAGGENNAFDEIGDQVVGDGSPGLEPLADNGGPTRTHALKAGSPALDKGKTSLATDQRGEARTVDLPDIPNAEGGDASDIGSHELQAADFEAPTCLGREATIFGTLGEGPITGTPGNDVIVGTSGPDDILAGGGDDIICGLGGDDDIFGDPGNDTILGGTGADTILGGEGDDLVFGEDGEDLLFGEEGVDRLRGGDGADRVRGGGGNDDIRGQGGGGDLRGNAGNDIILGGDGNEIILGGAGNDVLAGQTGVDSVFGEAGEDTVNVRDNAPDDLANGGDGNDQCATDPGDRSVFCEG